jgi:hypothetical protein
MSFGVCQQAAFDHQHLWNEYQEIKISPERPEQLKHEQLLPALRQLAEKWPSCFYIETAGRSVQGREIYLVKLGRGAQRIFLWSQMHGDEPTATNALLDIFNFLLVNREEQFAGDILEGATILALPMLNPDGAERYQRRNAQDIDVNRDARDLQTPEGRILKQVRDRFEPQFQDGGEDQQACSGRPYGAAVRLGKQRQRGAHSSQESRLGHSAESGAFCLWARFQIRCGLHAAGIWRLDAIMGNKHSLV